MGRSVCKRSSVQRKNGGINNDKTSRGKDNNNRKEVGLIVRRVVSKVSRVETVRKVVSLVATGNNRNRLNEINRLLTGIGEIKGLRRAEIKIVHPGHRDQDRRANAPRNKAARLSWL